MNYSLYLFGTNKGAYIQYPSDGEEAFLRPLCAFVKGTQLTIYRKDSLIHYAFFRRLGSDSTQVFGICFVTNGVYIKDIKVLYQTFDKLFSQIVFSGNILKLTGTGKILYISEDFASDKTGVEQTEAIVCKIIKEDLEPYATHIQQNFSGLIATKTIALEGRNSEILLAIEQNNIVHIYSDDNANSSINYVEQTIANLYNENGQLRADYSKLQSQKKQYRNVILLVLAVLICGVGLFFLKDSLNNTKSELSNAKSEISKLNNKVSDLNEELENTKTSLNVTREERDKVQQKMNDWKDEVGSSIPIIITDIQIANTYYSGDIETDYDKTIYSSNTMYLKPKISYTGIKTGENIDLNIKLYTPSGMSTGSKSPSGYSYSTSMYVYSGKNTKTLSGWGGSSRGHWGSGSYRFEIWYGTVCLKAKSFIID